MFFVKKKKQSSKYLFFFFFKINQQFYLGENDNFFLRNTTKLLQYFLNLKRILKEKKYLTPYT